MKHHVYNVPCYNISSVLNTQSLRVLKASNVSYFSHNSLGSLKRLAKVILPILCLHWLNTARDYLCQANIIKDSSWYYFEHFSFFLYMLNSENSESAQPLQERERNITTLFSLELRVLNPIGVLSLLWFFIFYLFIFFLQLRSSDIWSIADFEYYITDLVTSQGEAYEFRYVRNKCSHVL